MTKKKEWQGKDKEETLSGIPALLANFLPNPTPYKSERVSIIELF